MYQSRLMRSLSSMTLPTSPSRHLSQTEATTVTHASEFHQLTTYCVKTLLAPISPELPVHQSYLLTAPPSCGVMGGGRTIFCLLTSVGTDSAGNQRRLRSKGLK